MSRDYIIYPRQLGELNLFRKIDETKYLYEFIFEGSTGFTVSNYSNIRSISQNSKFYTGIFQAWFTNNRRDVFIDEYERD